MNVTASDQVLLALHYQNENCHSDGKIKIGIKQDADWRDEMLKTAMRLHAGARAAGVPIVHVRVAVTPGHREVIANNFIFKQWCELGAFEENTWGVEFYSGLEPHSGEVVVTHTRNNAFYGCRLDEVLALYRPKTLAVSGVSTAYVVESTVRHASDVGYDTLVIADACSTATREMHNNALDAMRLIARVATADEALAEFNAA